MEEMLCEGNSGGVIQPAMVNVVSDEKCALVL